MSDLKVTIAGAGGRMGAANIRAVVATPGLVLHAAFDRPGSPAIGRDAGEYAGLGTLGVVVAMIWAMAVDLGRFLHTHRH